ncbi:MAG: rhomboid family intramembrane serine protease [Chloroflexi bacterium]|nr:rhomboid family intramembrane serine protease [Chloroflexota bacterium]
MVLIVLANIAVFVYELGLTPRQTEIFFQSVGTIPVEIASGVDRFPAAPGPVYLTLLTSMFVHGGFMHIASNMLYLWVFGDNIEDVFGHLGFLAFYLVTGIAAGLTHVVVNVQSVIPSVGASGAVAGVLGAYMLLFPTASVRTLLFLPPFITVTRIAAAFLIGFWFLTQLVSGIASLDVQTQQTTGVAFWAHIGGFVAGVVVALVFRPSRPSQPSVSW